MNLKTKALIKDLELQIDYLIGYTPGGNHWKQEYYLRQTMINECLVSDDTPKYIIDKIALIQNTIYNLRNKKRHEQPYINDSMPEYVLTRPIKVRHNTNGELKEWYI